MQIHGLVVRNPQDLDRAFLTITRERLPAVAKSVRHLAGALQAMGYRVSRQLVAELLVAAGYSLRANRKTREGTNHPDRDAQFRYVEQGDDPAVERREGRGASSGERPRNQWGP